MIVRLVTCLVLVGALTRVSAEKVRYDGHHIISVNIENEQQRDFVERLETSSGAVKILETAAVNHEALLIVAPQDVDQIENMFLKEGIIHKVQTTNLQK